jgi:serine/threonine protein kinase
MAVGTPAYMSPEQILGHRIGPPSDVFSLGGLLYFAATGRAVFEPEHPSAAIYAVVHASADLTQISDSGLQEVIASCLIKDLAAVKYWPGAPLPAPVGRRRRLVRNARYRLVNSGLPGSATCACLGLRGGLTGGWDAPAQAATGLRAMLMPPVRV